MANKKSRQPDFKVESTSIQDDNLDASEAFTFMHSLVQAFQDGAYCLLEALRLVKSKDRNKDLDLILNDEQHSEEYLMRERFPFIK